METTCSILFRIRAIIITLIPFLFLLACQKKTDVETVKANKVEFSKTDSPDSINKKNIQSTKVVGQEVKIINTNYSKSINNKYKKAIDSHIHIYCSPESVSYPGGESELAKFLENNNSYNTIKYDLSIDGSVYLKLIIDTTGQVIGINILRGVGLGIDDEAIRVAGLLKFLPAKDSVCKTISSEYILKINFRKPHYTIVNRDGVTVEEINPENKKNNRWHFISNANPHYYGGKRKMQRFFNKSINYPIKEVENGVEGQVRMVLKIDETGRLANIIAYESIDPFLTKEAIRIVNLVDAWHPALIKHRHAPGYLSVTINFKIPNKLKNITYNKKL